VQIHTSLARKMLQTAVGLAFMLTQIPTPAIAQTTPFEINVILSLTGSAAFFGKAEAQSIALVESVTNKNGGIKGRPVKFVFADDGSNAQVSLQLASQLAAKGVPVTMGASLAATCAAIGPLVAKNGPVEYCLSPSIAPAPGSYVYSTSVATQQDAIAVVRYFRARRWNKIALITTTDASGQQFETYLDEALRLPENAGVTLLTREHFNPTDLSVTAQAERIKAVDPQAVIAWSSGTPTGTVLRGLHDTGIDVPVLSSNANMIPTQLAQYAGFAPRELYFPGRRALFFDTSAPRSVQAAQTVYFDAFKAAGETPNQGTTLGWDPAMIVVNAFRKLGTNATAAQLHDFIEHLSGWAGINGIYDFKAIPQRGIGIDAVIIERWDPAKSVFVPVSKGGGAH
jgi:branched-chain amino acid transport system substrate-binding protein